MRPSPRRRLTSGFSRAWPAWWRAWTTASTRYEFGEITRELYGFFWNEFCDWYIEFSKSRLSSDDAADRLACQRNLVFVLDQALRLLHPIMPFVTEEIYQELPCEKDAPYLIVAAWPDAEELARYLDADAERAIQMVTEVVSGIRSTRARYGISPKQALAAVVKASGADAALLEEQRGLLASMANLDELEIGEAAEKPAESAVVLGAGVEAYVKLSGLVDFDAERARLQKEQKTLAADVAKLEKKLSNPGFLAKAKPEIVEKDTAKRDELAEKLALVEAQLASLG